jgi:hypothetical protein
MASPEPFVFHGGIFPFQARAQGARATTDSRGDTAVPSVGGDFSRSDGPWDLADVGGRGPGRIDRVDIVVLGEGDASDSQTVVECTMSGVALPRVTATTLSARLVSRFDGVQHAFEAEVEAVDLMIDRKPYQVNRTLLAALQKKPAAAIRNMAIAGAASFAPTNGPDTNVACFVVQPAQPASAVSDVVVGEYAIGDRDRRLTMLRMPPAAPAAGAMASSGGGSVVLLQVFVNGHKPP